MNVERLYTVIEFLRDELQENNVPGLVTPIITAIDAQISQPQEAHLQQITNSLQALKTAIDASSLERIPQTWLPIVEALGVGRLVGNVLYERIRTAISASEPLLNEARDEIKRISAELNGKFSAMQQIISGLEGIGITPIPMEPGTVEASVLLPRDLFQNDLDDFAKETRYIDRLFKVCSDIATGKAESPKLDTISTSDPTYF